MNWQLHNSNFNSEHIPPRQCVAPTFSAERDTHLVADGAPSYGSLLHGPDCELLGDALTSHQPGLHLLASQEKPFLPENATHQPTITDNLGDCSVSSPELVAKTQ